MNCYFIRKIVRQLQAVFQVSNAVYRHAALGICSHGTRRGWCIPCLHVSLTAPASTPLPHSNDAKGVMQYMQQVQAAGIDNDDPLSSYMLQVGGDKSCCNAKMLV